MVRGAPVVLEAGRRPTAAPASGTRLALPSLVAALVLTASKVAAVASLTAAGWLFAGERAVVGLPLLVLPALASGIAPFHCLARRGVPDVQAGTYLRLPAPVLVLGAAVGASASLLVPVVLGFDPHPAATAALLAVAACGALMCWILFGPAGARRRSRAATAVGVLMLGTVLAAPHWIGSAAAAPREG
ncbi:hypothetical protein [Pseudarthrobacter sp. NamB4]|uniref:hypothetical protein n=1 Tax=Pseudarthrobacter sp. NamB4 TaxID=2576837 RepID=UPI001484ECDE|nr:hypothetical protein [Pseudarthrobacter sp. NamB4]